VSPVANRPDYAREVQNALTDPRALCEQLGLISGAGSFKRQSGGGVTVRCPWHEEKTPSCSVRIGRDGTIAVRCHGCGATGNALHLVAVANSLSTRREFRSVLKIAARLAGLWSIVHELETGTVDEERPKVLPPRVELAPEPEYPNESEVRAILAETIAVTDDAEVAAHLESRAIDPELVADANLARVIPASGIESRPRWAWYQGQTWLETGHRLILPVYDASGALRSVRAWRVIDGVSPKRLPPGGCKAHGLFLACPMALAWLRGGEAMRTLIVEGEPDFLVAATWRMRERTAVIGILSGAWTTTLAARFVAGQRVLVWTHRDRAGDAYAQPVAASLIPRGVVVGRWEPKGGVDG
jgi:DNA primase